jgi:unsaturated rhamnogalacturonyl hydrolase
MKKYLLIFVFLISGYIGFSQTWVDTLDRYARTGYFPAQDYYWDWKNAPIIHAMEYQYENLNPKNQKLYLDYVTIAMNRYLILANGIYPNAVASGTGMAFLYRITGNELYLRIALKVYKDYKRILKTSNGGVSHLPYAPELWDDTVYMIGIFLIGLYKATGDEIYLNELVFQIKAHQEKLEVEEWGLWVHGWDGDNKVDLDFCSQFNWPDPVTRRSSEIWGRGNGWVVVTLSEILNLMDESHPEWEYISTSLVKMIEHLPELQDTITGHWYQLPVRKGEEGNYLESSSTAMFGYGILNALKHNLVSKAVYEPLVHRIYKGLPKYSLKPAGKPENKFRIPYNIAAETCIGDKDYYYNIKTISGKVYSFGVFILFGRLYEETYIEEIPTPVINQSSEIFDIQLFPTLLSKGEQMLMRFFSKNYYSLNVSVTDLTGRILFYSNRNTDIGVNDWPISFTNFESGLYFLSVFDNQKVYYTEKFFVQ